MWQAGPNITQHNISENNFAGVKKAGQGCLKNSFSGGQKTGLQKQVKITRKNNPETGPITI